MSEPNLTYCVVTYNKVNSLKNVIAELLKYKSDDEEIVIIDGGSVDATKDFIRRLDNRIEYFYSAPDKGEAHAINRGLLASKGKIIKTISDDDAFFIPEIKRCKEWMLVNEDVDFLGTEGCVYSSAHDIGLSGYLQQYLNWKNNRANIFSFCGLGSFFRKSSIPLIGLYNANYARVDHEFGLRLTSSNVNFAWYTGLTWARIPNPTANSGLYAGRIGEETNFLDKVYFNRINGSVLTQLNKNADEVKKTQESFDNIIKHKEALEWLKQKNKNTTGEFFK
jgi:glycosyltransferase involved in cell wall biosynthesis